MYFYYVLLITILSPTIVRSYSTGAPKDACIDLIPQHHVEPQKSSAPYNLVLSKFDVKSDESIKVTVSGKGSTDTIKGFLVQARVGDKPVGQFIAGPNTQTLDCSASKDSITHSKIKDSGEKQVDFEWKPPSDLKGPVTFTATVARDGGTFWVGKVKQVVNII